MKGVIDRIEEGFAVVVWDDGRVERVEPGRVEAPAEGAVVFPDGEGGLAVDREETEARRREAKARMRSIFRRSGENGKEDDSK